ncbi:endonuclease III [Membranicola marinus]|uniref:Endonuclease III n=1 Tax=Membranihabitans marinus TaxID=1227546 RepID=A0A953LDF2_9BACT|nr:endonuclease III [Membranihabitans marinus]MBY5958799.1 endonuclease III [Membranihabitans marinus]
MTRKERAARIGVILDELYPEMEIPLHHKDPYTLLIAVLLSAQSTDKRVNLTTPALFELADNPFDMARVSVEDVRAIIRPVGLSPQKSKAIVKLSQILVDKYDGEVPADMELLEELPGVGHKTASVVMVQAFGKPAFPVDTHIHRLAYRWLLSTGRSVKKTEEHLKKAFPMEEWDRRHLQMIYFGREYCPARGHQPEECPICSVYGRRSMF